MGKLEALQKKIDQIADKVRHLRYILIMLMSGIIGTVFGISQHKIIDDTIVNSFFIYWDTSINGNRYSDSFRGKKEK